MRLDLPMSSRPASLLVATGMVVSMSCAPPPPAPPSVEDAGTPAVTAPIVLPPLAHAVTTQERTLRLQDPQRTANDVDNPSDPDVAAAMRADGLGVVVPGPGQPSTLRTFDGRIPGAGVRARRLARFVVVSDAQVMDDESPTRTAVADAVAETSGALRPQDPDLCRLLHAAVRTVNALHRDDPIDFVMLGGDNADSAQTNEVQWVMAVLDGGRVHCDSGDDDELDPDGDDGKDPFVSEGLAMPWRWVSGNHDVSVQGNFAIDDEQQRIALGSVASLGTRDYALRRGGAVRTGDFVVVDEARRLLDGPALLTLVSQDGDGHGLRDVDVASGKAFSSFDVGDALRIVVLDTTSSGGGASGLLSRADVEQFVRPALEQARDEGRAVVLTSHHALDTLTVDGGPFGRVVDDALLPDEWRAWLGEFPEVVFSLVGHTHVHRVKAQPTSGGAGFWEVMTASLADWPHQFRLIEVWDDDNGMLRMTAVPVDFDDHDDPVAHDARVRGALDQSSGYTFMPRDTPAEDANVTLLIPRPASMR